MAVAASTANDGSFSFFFLNNLKIGDYIPLGASEPFLLLLLSLGISVLDLLLLFMVFYPLVLIQQHHEVLYFLFHQSNYLVLTLNLILELVDFLFIIVFHRSEMLVVMGFYFTHWLDLESIVLAKTLNNPGLELLSEVARY